MAYIRTVRTASGALAVQIVAKHHGRRVIIAHIGSAHTDQELAVLKASARAQIARDTNQPPLDLEDVEPTTPAETMFSSTGTTDAQPALLSSSPADRPEPAPLTRAPQVISTASDLLWHVLHTAYCHLGFDVVADQVFEQVVLARIVEPTSKMAAGRVLTGLGQNPPHHTTIYRHLAAAQELGYREQIQDCCHRHAAGDGDVTLVLYDVTTLYFEAEKEDRLRRVGYSKERRVDPQLVIGLLVDRSGFPLQIGCFPGNKAETTTLIPVVSAYQDAHDLADMVVVADAGMLSVTNLEALDAAGLRFIVGSRQVKAPGDLAHHFHWSGTAFDDGQIIDTITPHRAPRTAPGPRSERAEPVWDPAQ
ncbi:MAG: IS1634 family transposase, partial [Acidipropionibacterium sp.]|nr:IS1634 family transposase [Acidipropionibacterium sp.]